MSDNMDFIPNPSNRKEHDEILDAYGDYLDESHPDMIFNERHYSAPRDNPLKNGLKPDIIGKDLDGKIRLIAEIETPGLVNVRHAMGHWDAYAESGLEFHLVVPDEDIESASGILEDLGIDDKTTLIGYDWENGSLIFNEY